MTPFEKAVMQLIKNVHHIEDFSERIVHAAVDETLQRIADTYGIDLQTLRTLFFDDIVKKYSKATTDEPACKAITYRGKRCTNTAISDGLCQMHLKQQVRPRKSKASTSHKDTLESAHKLREIFESIHHLGSTT